MYSPIQPARLEFDPAGIPCSNAYGDVYHSADGGLGQARHVFLAGNDLPGRWARQRRFVILETGFGLGLNFLATWAAWRADPARCERLHFISCEKHPFRTEDLARLHATWPEFADISTQLQTHWPALTPGFHRLHLDGGRVILTLLFGEGADTLAELDACADAIYLDGFSPARNPELWSPRVFHLLARLSGRDTTLATWSVAGSVREGLTHAGFQVAKTDGFGGKRQMLTGRLVRAPGPKPIVGDERHALVVGAGLAGSAVVHRLAERGWRVDVIDAAAGPGQGASGNLAGVLRPLPSLDDNRLARLTRAGTLYGLHHLSRLAEAGWPVRWNASGVLHLARDAEQEAKQRRLVECHQAPEAFLRFVDREEASRLAGWPLPIGGWWFSTSGWVQPPSLCAANLDGAGPAVTRYFGQILDQLDYREGKWHALAPDGRTIAAAPIAIMANGTGLRAVAQLSALPVVSARGQVAHLPAAAESPPQVVVCRNGYVSPAVDGQRCAGASFAVEDDERDFRMIDHLENLAKLDFMLPGFTLSPDMPPAGRVGFRPASPDRLPMVGAVPSVDAIETSLPLSGIPRQPGLYAISGFGARGLVWSSLMGEFLASVLEGEPLPLEHSLATALDPARFLLRPRRPNSPEY